MRFARLAAVIPVALAILAAPLVAEAQSTGRSTGSGSCTEPRGSTQTAIRRSERKRRAASGLSGVPSRPIHERKPDTVAGTSSE
jgi:hypothetical protein